MTVSVNVVLVWVPQSRKTCCVMRSEACNEGIFNKILNIKGQEERKQRQGVFNQYYCSLIIESLLVPSQLLLLLSLAEMPLNQMRS